MKLRHDHGSNYMSGDFQDEIECLGIEASPSFVREPEGNGVAERFIRTLKENLLILDNLIADALADAPAAGEQAEIDARALDAERDASGSLR